MKIPTELRERHALYRNLIRECDVSRGDRRVRNTRLRTWLLTGTQSGQQARYNKLAEHVNASSSYLYSPGSVRFGVVYPPIHGDKWADEEEAARDEMQRLWLDSKANLVFKQGVTWAHAWPTAVYKVYTDEGEPTLDLVQNPADVGVLQEDMDDWDTQEAIVHWYTLSVSQYRRLVSALPNASDLFAEGESHAGAGGESRSETLPAAVERLILAQATPNMVGAIEGIDIDLAAPMVREPVVECAELWVRDDAIDDYRVVKMHVPTQRILMDPKNPLLPGRHCFHPLTLDPVPGYIWGYSTLQGLLGLQAWREDKVAAIDRRENLQLNPPLFFEGMAGITEEKARAFREPGGNLSSGVPGSKVTPIVPQPIPDPFATVAEIDRSFSNRSGLPQGMRGGTEPGVRSGEQAIMQAMLGAGPTLDRALLVENCLESIATDLLRLRRLKLERPLIKSDGKEFFFSQMPGDFTVRVSAHSASPVYAQQIVQKAVIAKQQGAIDSETFLELLDLPMLETLKARSRKLAQGQAEHSERVLRIQEEKAARQAGGGKGGRGGAR